MVRMMRQRKGRYISILLISLLVLTSMTILEPQSPHDLAILESQTPGMVPVQTPVNILRDVPIIIHNSQNSSTGSDFQEELVVNSSRFSQLESLNLQNVEFFYRNGSIIPSWLESGNTNNSTQTIYWLKLVNGIAANSSVTIYMGFAAKNENLFNNINTGEAPELSASYGEYDDGANVFLNYWNFNGTSLPSVWRTLTNSQPVAVVYYNANISRAFEMIDRPSGSRWVNGISTGYSQGSIGYAFVFYPGVSYWGDDGTSFGLYSYNSSPQLLNPSGPGTFPIQMGVGYNGKTVSSIYGSNFTSVNSSSVSLSTQNTIFVSSDTWGVGGGSTVSVNNGLILSVSTGAYGQISTETNFIAIAFFPPNGVMPTATIDGYAVSFNEIGYPAGMQWSTIIGDHIFNSTTDTVSVILTPGEYTYRVIPGYGRYPSPSSGIISVSNSNVTINISYVLVEPTAEVPLTIENNQSVPTGIYQQFLLINGSNYSKYINGNWSNVEFTYQNSTFIPAWIEGPVNNTSYALIILKLNSIPGKSNLTINMDILPEDISILSEYGPTGEGYYSTQGFYLTYNYSWYDNGNEVFPVYTIFDGPTIPSSWFLTGSAQFIPNVGVETVNGNGNEMGAVIFKGNLSGGNITVYADTYYRGSADQQNFGVYANDPSSNTGDNGGVGTVGYTMGFDPYYGSNQIYYNGQSVAKSGFWNGGTSYFSESISVNSTSINYTVIQMSSNSMPNFYYINYSANVVKQGGLFFSSSTGGSNSVQFIYDLEVVNSPPDNYMPTVIFGNISTKKYNVTFYESGLKNGTKWYLNISGQSHLSTTGSAITTALMNGTYSYTVSTGHKEFESLIPSGNFTVIGGPISVSVLFVRVYNVSFTESGLSFATVWYINISGRPLINSNARTISVYLTNGSYTYKVGTANGKYYAKGGSFAVSGANISESVSFTLVTYSVSFGENGLPAGTKWYLNITDETSVSSNTSIISTLLSNGTYEYSVSAANKSFAPTSPIGSFTVDGNSVSQVIQFSKGYVVTFVESGLPPLSEWFVNISGQPSVMSNTTSASISLINGSYNYVVGMLNHSYRAPGGSFVISGSGISQYVDFVLVVYPITFTETGLPSGTRWYLNITNQAPLISISNSITVSLPNSTYTFEMATSDKDYKPSASSGSFVINGTSFTQQVSFYEVTYNVTFIESGLTSGNWYVNISSTSQSFSEPYSISTITFNEQNGTYLYSIGDNYSDESPQIQRGVLVINGSNVIRSVSFSRAYSVVFNGGGLPFLVNWEIKIGNQTYATSGSSLIVFLADGKYQYDATVTTNVGASITSSGQFTVENSNTQVNLSFAPNYSYVLTTFLIPIVLVIMFSGGTFVIKRLKG